MKPFFILQVRVVLLLLNQKGLDCIKALNKLFEILTATQPPNTSVEQQILVNTVHLLQQRFELTECQREASHNIVNHFHHISHCAIKDQILKFLHKNFTGNGSSSSSPLAKPCMGFKQQSFSHLSFCRKIWLPLLDIVCCLHPHSSRATLNTETSFNATVCWCLTYSALLVMHLSTVLAETGISLILLIVSLFGNRSKMTSELLRKASFIYSVFSNAACVTF